MALTTHPLHRRAQASQRLELRRGGWLTTPLPGLAVLPSHARRSQSQRCAAQKRHGIRSQPDALAFLRRQLCPHNRLACQRVNHRRRRLAGLRLRGGGNGVLDLHRALQVVRQRHLPRVEHVSVRFAFTGAQNPPYFLRELDTRATGMAKHQTAQKGHIHALTQHVAMHDGIQLARAQRGHGRRMAATIAAVKRRDSQTCLAARQRECIAIGNVSRTDDAGTRARAHPVNHEVIDVSKALALRERDPEWHQGTAGDGVLDAIAQQLAAPQRQASVGTVRCGCHANAMRRRAGRQERLDTAALTLVCLIGNPQQAILCPCSCGIGCQRGQAYDRNALDDLGPGVVRSHRLVCELRYGRSQRLD